MGSALVGVSTVSTSGATSDIYFGFSGSQSNGVDRLRRQWKAGASFTVRNARVYVSANTRSATSNIRLQKNGSNANLNVAITAGNTGWFEDISNTDSIADNDLLNWALVAGTGTGSVTFETIHATIDTTSGNYPLTAYGWAATTPPGPSAGNTYYFTLNGAQAASMLTAEANAKCKMRCTGTWGNIQILARSNSVSVSSTYRSRKNGANGNQSVSIPATTSGLFEDGTNTDTIADGDEINTQLVIPAGSGSFTADCGGSMFTATENATDLWTCNTNSNTRTSSTATEFIGLVGSGNRLATEANANVKWKFAATLSKLRVLVTSASGNVTDFTLRKNGADTSLKISTIVSTTGWYEDATNSVSFAVDDLACIKVSAASSATVVWYNAAVKCVITDGVAGGGGGGGRRRPLIVTN
jgi:hypothetical protein